MGRCVRGLMEGNRWRKEEGVGAGEKERERDGRDVASDKGN